MERYSEVIGLPVICVDSGKKLGVIEDIMFCPPERSVTAFVLGRKGCQVDKRLIPLEDIANLGRDALIVYDSRCVKRYQKIKEKKEFKTKGDVKGLRIYTRAGEDLGIVKDILFDCKTGQIEGVEVSDGVFADLIQGRKILPLFGRVEFSEESMLVDREAVEEMISTGGGLKRIIDN